MSYPKQKYFPSAPIAIPGQENSTMDIWRAIDFNNFERVKEILSEDKSKMLDRSWNDMYPIHHACLRGQLEIVQLLVSFGADINSLTSFEETPIQYACRSGNVPIVHWLCQNGANHRCKDKRGRRCMHFAAMGSSITVMHYLATQLNHKYDVADNTGQSVLHVCSEKNNTILYAYLLKSNRVDPSCSDLKGITPMHILAEKGHGEMTWQLLQVGRCGLLQLKNHANETPVQLGYCGKTDTHRNLAKELEKYSKYPPEQPPNGPRLRWYTSLCLPFTTMSIVFMLSSYLNGNKGYFTFTSMIMLAVFVIKQSHRLNHISKWPNPIFMGLFFGGILHCTIAQYYKIYPTVWPCPWHVLISTTFVVSVYYMFYMLSSKSPGVNRFPKLDPTSGNEMTILDIAERRCRDFDFCPHTECIKHVRAKYCKICETVVVDMDHHCLFINNCVAGKNHRSFVLFIFNVMILQLLFLISFYTYSTNVSFVVEKGSFNIFALLSNMFHTEPWILSLAGLSFFSLIWESTLILSQLDAIARGETIYSSMKHGLGKNKTLKTRDRLNNIVKFFIKPRKDSRYIEKIPLMYA